MSFSGSGDGSYTQKQLNYILNRQRSLPVIQSMPSSHQPVITLYQHQVLEYNMGNKSKYATLEIYKPPGLRGNTNRPVSMDEFQAMNYNNATRRPTSSSTAPNCARAQLNVHAKEFSFGQISTSGADRNKNDVNETGKSLNPINCRYNVDDLNEMSNERMYQLRMSKSSGNLLSTLKNGNGSSQNTKSKSSIRQNYPASTSKSVQFRLQKAKSNECVLPFNQGNKVKFKETAENMQDKNSVRIKSGNDQYKHVGTVNHQIATSASSLHFVGGNLKRSKSLSATDAMKLLDIDGSRINSSTIFTEYDKFSPDVQALIAQAVKDPNDVPDRNVMVLARTVLEDAVANRDSALPAAKLSIIIVQKDKKGTYLDTILNTCQLWFQERHKRLRNNGVRFTSFFTFLNHFYNQLKRSQLQLKLDTSPTLTLLTLLCKCCQDTLQHSEKHSFLEVESLFIVLTSIGKDLENELPDSLRRLYVIIRDVFLKSNDDTQVKKMLLQLIELRAAKWQLPMSAVGYYYYTKRMF